MQQITVKLGFDPVKDGKVSIKIRITYKRDQRKYSLPNIAPIIVSKATYEKITAFHNTGNLRISQETRELYGQIKPHIERAYSIIDKLSPFDFNNFKILFENFSLFDATQSQDNTPITGNPLNIHTELQLLKEKEYSLGSIKNGNLCESASQSLKRFLNGVDQLLFTDITPEFLSRYEAWMLKKGKAPKKEKGRALPASITTISIYIRQIRKAFNSAISKKLIPSDCYPFNKKYIIPSEEGHAKALEKSDIIKIFKYTAEEGSYRQRSRDLWIFTYLSNGINMKDICSLRWSQVDLKNKQISFKRQKTIRTRKERQKDIIVNLHEESLAIIKRWGTRQATNDYVFPFVNDQMDDERKRATIDGIISVTNDHMAIIAKEVGINKKVRTYEARHSFATILLQTESVPLYFISEALGHTSFSTTEKYLGRFNQKQTKQYVSALLPIDDDINAQ